MVMPHHDLVRCADIIDRVFLQPEVQDISEPLPDAWEAEVCFYNHHMR